MYIETLCPTRLWSLNCTHAVVLFRARYTETEVSCLDVYCTKDLCRSRSNVWLLWQFWHNFLLYWVWFLNDLWMVFNFLRLKKGSYGKMSQYIALWVQKMRHFWNQSAKWNFNKKEGFKISKVDASRFALEVLSSAWIFETDLSANFD